MSDWCPICKMRKANPAKCPHDEFLRVTEPGAYAVEHLERMYRAWMMGQEYKQKVAVELRVIVGLLPRLVICGSEAMVQRSKDMWPDVPIEVNEALGPDGWQVITGEPK